MEFKNVWHFVGILVVVLAVGLFVGYLGGQEEATDYWQTKYNESQATAEYYQDEYNNLKLSMYSDMLDNSPDRDEEYTLELIQQIMGSVDSANFSVSLEQGGYTHGLLSISFDNR